MHLLSKHKNMTETLTQPNLATPEADAPQATHSLQENLAYWGGHLDQVQQNIVGFEGTGEIPDDFYVEDMQRVWGLKDQIIESAAPEDTALYLQLKHKDQVITSAIRGVEPRTLGHEFHLLSYTLGEEVMGRIMAQEDVDGPLHNAMLSSMEFSQAEGYGALISEIKVLKASYGLASACELLGVRGDAFSDRVREVLKSNDGIRYMQSVDGPEDGIENYDEQRQARREWMARLLSSSADIDADTAKEYVFSAAVRYEHEDMLHIVDMFEHFGVERMHKISKFTGIHGLERYSLAQLERMERFVDDPESAAEQLAEHDVVVSMINGVGDYNGVMKDTPKKIDDDTGRVLFFEINNMTDIYRVMARLGKRGVKPSTLMLSAHSGEGRFMVTDYREPSSKKRDVATVAGEKLVRMANDPANGDLHEPGVRGYSMNGMAGLGRMIEGFMAPSRAIEDAAEDSGSKKIIFNACYAGKETQVRDVDENGSKYVTGEESVISQLAEDLRESRVMSRVDIYGAPDGMQMHRTSEGLRYSGQPVEGSGFGRTQMHAVRMRLENGVVKRDEVDEIPLRQAV